MRDSILNKHYKNQLDIEGKRIRIMKELPVLLERIQKTEGEIEK